MVYGNARVSDNAWVSGNASVFGNAKVYGNASVFGNAKVYGDTSVYGDAKIYGETSVSGNAQVFGNAWVFGNACICGYAWINGYAWIFGNAWVSDNARIFGNAKVSDNARIFGNASVYGEFHAKYGNLTSDILESISTSILVSLNVLPSHQNKKGENIYKLYKRVNKTNDPDIFISLHDPSFKYKLNSIIECPITTNDPLKSCSTGIHVSTPGYWDDGDTLLEVLVNEKDIFCCMSGKIRASKVKVTRVINL